MMMILQILLITPLVMAEPMPIYESGGEKFKFEVLTEQKDVVWGFDFLDDQRVLFTERGGALRVLHLPTKTVSEVQGGPVAQAVGQGGLLDVRVHPTQKNKIYFTYSEASSEQGLTTALATGTFVDNKITGLKKIFSAREPGSKSIHFGSRIEFDGKGYLWISVGDRDQRERAQDRSFHNGKIIRMKEDGSAPEIWSLGHRNPQGLVRNPETNELWATEMGPRGGDELNLIRRGANYGWPVITYGREYYGPKIGEGTAKAGMEQPIQYWVPSISPSGTTFYTGSAFPKWKGQIFIGTLSGQHLRRLKLAGTRVVEQIEMLKGLDLRIRNVRTGPDGFLYLSTDDGKLARLVP